MTVISRFHKCVYIVSGNAAEMTMQRMQTTDRIVINWDTSLPTSTAMHQQPMRLQVATQPNTPVRFCT